MDKKLFEITYNPYTNSVHFRQQIGIDETGQVMWGEIEPDSQLMKFQQQRCIFENCIEDIIDPINKYYNTSDGFCIVFNGTSEDFDALNKTIGSNNNSKSSIIECVHEECYPSPSIVLNEIVDAYKQIKSEFDDYIENKNNTLKEDDERLEIGKAVSRFNDTIRAVIPVCIIGNYSVGKSALVNAIVGREVLPSQATSTTAKNVVIRNSNEYSVQFTFDREEYRLDISDLTSIQCTGVVDSELIDELIQGTETLTDKDKRIHQIVENLNNGTSNSTKLAGIEGNVLITLPFTNSELDTSNYTFEIVDTPGSNKTEEEKRIHRMNLEQLMDEQTNALPIFVMNFLNMESTDNTDLIELLESKKAGFALQNCIIVISMSDQLVERQIAEELPQKIEQWIPHPTIMYVSPVAAIGEKKQDKGIWIDQAYKQIYETKTKGLVQVVPPRYNHTPCGREIDAGKKNSMSMLLYASGIPSLETEINYFAYRFAEFKKCYNSREYLLEALDLADKKLFEARKNQETEKEKRKKDQKEQRNRIIMQINSINPPSVNDVIRAVKPIADGYLKEYCDSVEWNAKRIWQNCKNSKNARKLFQDAMVYHCQTNLYDKRAPEIKGIIKETLTRLASAYMEKVRTVEKNEYSKLSVEAQHELDSLFIDYKSGPVLRDVAFGKFEILKQLILLALPFKKAHDAYVKQFAEKFCANLRGKDNYERQCITEPVRQYCKQVNDWSQNYRKKVYETLDKDSSILSDLDEKIRQSEEKIEDMSNRIENLSEVRARLQGVLPV